MSPEGRPFGDALDLPEEPWIPFPPPEDEKHEPAQVADADMVKVVDAARAAIDPRHAPGYAVAAIKVKGNTFHVRTGVEWGAEVDVRRTATASNARGSSGSEPSDGGRRAEAGWVSHGTVTGRVGRSRRRFQEGVMRAKVTGELDAPRGSARWRGRKIEGPGTARCAAVGATVGFVLVLCVWTASATAAAGGGIAAAARHHLLQGSGGHGVEFSRDGKFLLTRGPESARVWDVKTLDPVGPPLRHAAGIRAAALSGDGRRVLTAGGGEARVRDAETGRPVGPAVRHGDEIVTAALSPDGSVVATAAAEDHVVALWDAGTGKRLAGLEHPGPVRYVAFDPKGERVLTVDAARRPAAHLWSAHGGRELIPPIWSFSLGRDVPAAFSDDGSKLVVAFQYSAGVFDAGTGKAVCDNAKFAPDDHEFGFERAVSLSPDGTRFLTVTSSFTRVWDAATGEPVGPEIGVGDVHAAVFTPDGKGVVAAGAKESAGLWDLAAGKRVRALPDEGTGPVAVSPDGKWAALGSPDDAERGDGDTVLQSIAPEPREMAEPASRCGTEAEEEAEEPATREAGRLHGPGGACVSFSADGKAILTAGDEEVRVWDVATLKPLTPPLRHGRKVVAAALSPDRKRVATAGGVEAKLWDGATGKLLASLPHEELAVWSVAFSPDGSRLVTGGGDGAARVWDAGSGKPLAVLKHPGVVAFVAYSPDGRTVLTVSGRAAHLWDAATDKERVEPLKGADRGLLGGDARRQPGLLQPRRQDGRHDRLQTGAALGRVHRAQATGHQRLAGRGDGAHHVRRLQPRRAEGGDGQVRERPRVGRGHRKTGGAGPAGDRRGVRRTRGLQRLTAGGSSSPLVLTSPACGTPRAASACCRSSPAGLRTTSGSTESPPSPSAPTAPSRPRRGARTSTRPCGRSEPRQAVDLRRGPFLHNVRSLPPGKEPDRVARAIPGGMQSAALVAKRTVQGPVTRFGSRNLHTDVTRSSLSISTSVPSGLM